MGPYAYFVLVAAGEGAEGVTGLGVNCVW